MQTAITLYTSPWCAPCKAFKPLLQKLAEELKVPLAIIDIAEHPESAEKHGVRSVPTFVLTRGGEECHRHTGTMQESHLREMLSS